MPEQEPPPEKPLPSSGAPWQVILEDIRSQNRTTIEAVEALHIGLDRKIEEHRAETRAQFQVLEAAVRQNSTDVRVLQGDVRNLIDKVDTAHSDIEGRVSALERRLG